MSTYFVSPYAFEKRDIVTYTEEKKFRGSLYTLFQELGLIRTPQSYLFCQVTG